MTTLPRPLEKIWIGPSGRAALHLLACCPRIPTDVVAVLLRMRHARSAAQLLLRLRTSGLAQCQPVKLGPLVESRAVRLWTLTAAGRAVLSYRGLEPSGDGRSQLPYGKPARWRDVARQRDVPLLVVAYRLLARVVHDLDQPVRVAAWEHPWIRTLAQPSTRRSRHVRLPAAAVITQHKTDGELARRLLLLPDLGTIPVAGYRPVLGGLSQLAQTSEAGAEDEALLVVGVATGAGSNARVAAWQTLFRRMAQGADQPLPARVFVFLEGLGASAGKDRQLGDQAEQVFGLVARHPLLTRHQLAVLLDTSEARVGQLIRQLTERDFVRTIRSDQVFLDSLRHNSGQRRRLVFVELTSAGRREAARRLLLTAAVASRHHGLLGNDGSSRRFSWHLAHTIGANAVFVAFVVAARRAREQGGHEALEEWRSAAACARGRFRPDGYGCYRLAGSRFGFFLEYDRGTERPGEYATKLAAYYRYRDARDSTREYDGFPMLLVVTTSDVAESRFAQQAWLASRRLGTTPISMFLTTTNHIEAHANGVLGPVWRTPGPDPWTYQPLRMCWLPRPVALDRTTA